MTGKEVAKKQSGTVSKHAGKVAKHVGPRVAPYVPPWALSASAWPVAGAAHLAWAGNPTMTAAMAGASVCLTAWTWKAWEQRHKDARNAATVYAGALSGWITLAAINSPTDSGLTNAWALGGSALAIAWNIRHTAKHPQAENDHAVEKSDGLWEKVRRLKGTRTKKVVEGDQELQILAQLPAGELTPADVQGERARIASALAVEESAVRVDTVPGRGDQAMLVVSPVDQLAESLWWTGPSHFGQSIADAPLRLGMRADRSEIGLWIVGSEEDARPLPHTLTTGMTGAGKTETTVLMVVEGRTRIDVAPVIGDPAKFGQSFMDIADCFEIIADGREETSELIDRLPGVIEYRAALLGKLGYKQWEPECWAKHGIPLVPFHLEEAADVLAGNEAFVEGMRKCRSIGVPIMASLQSAGYTDMPRKARGMFGNSLAHGMSDSIDANFALQSSTLQAGADPTRWKNEQPGSLFAELVGTERHIWPIPGRAFRTKGEWLRKVIDASKPHWAHLDDGTAKAFGASGQEALPVTDAGVAAIAPQRPLAAEDRPRLPINHESEFDTVNVDQPLPPVRGNGRMSFRKETSATEKMTTEAARLVLEQHIDAMEESGRKHVTPPDCFAVLQDVGRVRGWIYHELERLADEGRLERCDGRNYRIRARVPASA